MKKLFALLLALTLMLSLAACGGEDKETAAGDNTSTTQTEGSENTDATEESTGAYDATDSTENSTPATDSTEGTSTLEETSKPTETTKPIETTKPNKPTETVKPSTHEHKYTSKTTKNATCTEKGKKTFTCSCGDNYTEDIPAKGHSWGEWETIKAPTTTSEGISQRKCDNCSVTENKSIAKLPVVEQKSYYVSHEVTKIERPKTFYVDGVDVLTLARGKNWVQVCDTIKIKVNMSDGGSDFTVKKTIGGTGFTYEKKGNEVWITPDGTTSYIEVLISVKNKNGNSENIVIALYDVYKSNANLSEEQEVEQMLKSYGQQLGMRYTGNGPEILTMQYTTALIYENFKIEAFKTLKKWANDGYTVFTMTVTNYCFDGAAGK